MKKGVLILIIGGMITLPVFVMFQPPNYFDTGASICPSKLIFGMECPGCGMTRATQHMIHFEFQKAWEFNKLSFIVVPILGVLYLRIVYKLIKKVKTN